jgi:DNA polymerase-3 subunit beta
MSPTKVIAAMSGGDRDVSLTVGDKKVDIQSGRLSLAVDTLHADDFPHDGDRELDAFFTATLSAKMIGAIDRVSYAISVEETRYYLNGVNVKQLPDGQYRFAATDGHRLCCIDMRIPDANGDIGDIIIPRRVVRLLSELATKAPGDIKIAVGTVPPANRDDSTAPARSGAPRFSAAFECEGAAVTLRAKLIDGTFPDYARVIPTANDKPLLFNVAELRKALKGVTGYGKDHRAVKVELGKDGANLSAAFVNFGISAAVTVPCQHASDGFTVGLNGAYLLDMLDSVRGEEIVFTASDTSGPLLVKDPADTQWTGVLMPMRV